MKFIALFSFVLLAAFIGQTFAEGSRKPAAGNRFIRHRRPAHRQLNKKPCGSNDLGDYKGGCDVSVPVLVMPKGRPIMERVLDWFGCEDCSPTQTLPTITITTDGTIPTATGTITTETLTPTGTGTAATWPGTVTGTGAEPEPRPPLTGTATGWSHYPTTQ